MAVIQSNNRILRAGEGQGNTYFPGDYIDINENNVISFTGDFSGLSAKVDECCSAVNEEISGIKDDLSGLSSQMEDCCSSVNQNLDDLWSAVNENSANIQINSVDLTQLSSIVNTKLDANDFNNFRSAYNVTIDELYNHDNYLSGIIDQKLDASAYHEYSAGDNISIANYIVSGKDWTPTIESAMSSVKGHEYSGSGYISVNNDTDIISLSEVIEPIPWISGWSEMGNVTAEWGQSFRVVSSHDLSGYRNHAIGVKGSWITLPTTANIASALDSKLDTSSFNSFISNEYSTAKNDIINQIYSKQDKSGMSAYVPYSAISGSDNIITGINGSALSAGLTYTAGPNIAINDNEISGKDWTDDITAASSYAYEQATASIPGVQEYSAGANIDITNHVISGKDWSDEIAAAAGGITAVQSALTANFAFSSNSATYDSDGNVITATYLSSIPEGYVSSVNNLTPTIVSGGINSHEIKLSGAWPTGLPLSGLDPIQVTKTDNKVVISITGGVGNTYDVKAGNNINVATAGGTAFTVSGKSWTKDITAASSYAYNQATAHAQGKIYTGIDPIVVDNTPMTGTISAWDAVLSAQWPLTIVTSYIDNYETDTIVNSGLTFSNVVGGVDGSIASAHVAHKRNNQYTEYYSIALRNTAGSTNEFTLISTNTAKGWLRADGAGAIISDTIRESKIYNYEFTTGDSTTALQMTASGYTEVHITTPYHYDGPSGYSATLDNQTFVLGSGAYGVFGYQNIEGTKKWVTLNSGYYEIG